jgi:hypothetical protein
MTTNDDPRDAQDTDEAPCPCDPCPCDPDDCPECPCC